MGTDADLPTAVSMLVGRGEQRDGLRPIVIVQPTGSRYHDQLTARCTERAKVDGANCFMERIDAALYER